MPGASVRARQAIGWFILIISTGTFLIGMYLAGVANCQHDCGYATGSIAAGVIIASVAWFIIGILIKNSDF